MVAIGAPGLMEHLMAGSIFFERGQGSSPADGCGVFYRMFCDHIIFFAVFHTPGMLCGPQRSLMTDLATNTPNILGPLVPGLKPSVSRVGAETSSSSRPVDPVHLLAR